MCPAYKDKVEILSAWALLVGKHQQNQNFTYSSLTLGTLNKMKLMLCVLFNYVMGDKIKRLSMSVAFKYIWQKGLSFLTLEGLSIYKSLHDYDYHLPEIRCASFRSFGYGNEINKMVLGTSSKN